MFSGLSLDVRRARPSFRPILESLEGRDCPSAAPVITSLTATPGGSGIIVEGMVSDENPQTVMVEISGAASGFLTPAADGSFSGTFDVNTTGDIYATATDEEGLDSTALAASTMDSSPVNSAPVFNYFWALREDGPGNYWTFTGQVSDENPESLTVYLNGLPELNNLAVSVGADGCFSITIQLAEGCTGTASADVIDLDGVPADTAYAVVG